MDPSVVVTGHIPSTPKFNKTVFLLISLAVVVALIGGVWYFTSNQNKTTQKNTKTAVAYQTVSQVHKKRDIKGDLERQLKLTFNSTKYYEDINIYIKQADKAKTTTDAYTNYLKAYSFVSKAYTDTKKGEYRTVLVQFRDFLKAFPMYKTSEVIIPK